MGFTFLTGLAAGATDVGAISVLVALAALIWETREPRGLITFSNPKNLWISLSVSGVAWIHKNKIKYVLHIFLFI